jgi:glycosyltransferase involved in cell wall biosynthesis
VKNIKYQKMIPSKLMNAEKISSLMPQINTKNTISTAIAPAIARNLTTQKITTIAPTLITKNISVLPAEPAICQIPCPEKVSIIMPAFNAANTIGEAISSILSGTHRNVEILVIDDGSRDETSKIVTAMAQAEPRIKYYKNEKNLGAYKSRNVMLKIATGQFIAFLDSDDTWEPNKLEECLKMLKQHPEVKAVGHALRYLDKRGNKVSYIPTYPTNQAELQDVQENGALPWVFPTALVVEREAILEIGGFLDDWKVGADTELMARLAHKHGMLATKMPLGNYRVLGNSLTDKYWLTKRIAIDCVKENQQRRIRGEAEFTLSEYQQISFQNLSPWKKLNKFREILATRFMRKAGESWLNREILPTLFYGVATTALNPQATLHKIQWMKYQKRLSKDFS